MSSNKLIPTSAEGEITTIPVSSLHRSQSDTALDLMSKEAVSINRNVLLIDQDTFHDFTKEMRGMWQTFASEQDTKVTLLMEALNKFKERKKIHRKPSDLLGKYEELKARIETLEKERRSDRKMVHKLEGRVEQVEKLTFVTYLGMRRLRSLMKTFKVQTSMNIKLSSAKNLIKILFLNLNKMQ